MIKTLYVYYAHYGDYPVTIRLMDEAKYLEFKGWQPNDERIHKADIHADSTREDDPVIEIVTITEHARLGQERAVQIEQEVANWLADNGHIRPRT